jgi:hypothetical protein
MDNKDVCILRFVHYLDPIAREDGMLELHSTPHAAVTLVLSAKHWRDEQTERLLRSPIAGDDGLHLLRLRGLFRDTASPLVGIAPRVVATLLADESLGGSTLWLVSHVLSSPFDPFSAWTVPMWTNRSPCDSTAPMGQTTPFLLSARCATINSVVPGPGILSVSSG